MVYTRIGGWTSERTTPYTIGWATPYHPHLQTQAQHSFSTKGEYMTFVKADPWFTSYQSLVFERRRKQHGGIVHGDTLFYNSFAEAFELCLTVGISQVE